MLTAILVLLVLNFALTILTVSAVGNVAHNQFEDAGAACQKHNFVVRKLDDLNERNQAALDCLVVSDAALSAYERKEQQE